MLSIIAKTREPKADLEVLRGAGDIPAVYYGAGVNSTSISIPKTAFQKIWREAGESTPIELAVDGKKVNVLIHEVALHAVSNEPTHVDFKVVDMNKKVSVFVPLEFTGVAPAVKNGLGTLVKVMHEIEIEALPKDLPHSVVVDISALVDLESQLSVSDIALPNGVTAITKGAEIVVSIAAQQEEKEDTGPVDLSSIEVEKKGKKEEEAAE